MGSGTFQSGLSFELFSPYKSLEARRAGNVRLEAVGLTLQFVTASLCGIFDPREPVIAKVSSETVPFNAARVPSFVLPV